MTFEQSAAAERGASSSLVVCIVTETPILVRVVLFRHVAAKF
jgi:hypothetical protein